MPNAFNVAYEIAPAIPTVNAIVNRHLADANRALVNALHYHRYFSRPVVGFSTERNAARATANDAAVRTFARSAGISLYRAGHDVLALAAHPALQIERIWESYEQGWRDGRAMLTGRVAP